jgi:hypothetical protein
MSQTITRPFTASGTYSWICPSDVAAALIELWGGGGAGGGSTANNNGGGGGAGGQYARKLNTVSAATVYSLVVAASVTGTTGNGGAGNDSSFNSTDVVAKGGAGGTGNNGAGGAGATTSGVGDQVFAGGSGSAGALSTRSGGGGGGAGSNGAGGSTTASTTAGTGTASSGGAGGAGRASGTNLAGLPGTAAGGAGGGAYRTATTSRAGGNGAAGQAQLTYSTNDVDIITLVTQNTSASATATVPITIPAGYFNTKLILLDNTYTGAGQSQSQIISCKFNGMDMTLAIDQVAPVGMNNHQEIFYFDSPIPGTYNVVVQITGGAGDDNQEIVLALLANAAPGTPDTATGQTTASNTTGSIAITPKADKCVIFSHIQSGIGATGPTPGAGQATLYNNDLTNCFSYSGAKTPAAAVTHTYAGGAAGENWVAAAVAIAPYTGQSYAPNSVRPAIFKPGIAR